jgi:beta-glucosidase
VLLLDAGGEVLATEERSSGQLTWLAGFGDEVPRERVAAIEVRARLRARVAGEHEIGVAGAGRYVLLADGEELVQADLEVAPDADPIELLVVPPQVTTTLALDAGQELDLVLRHELDPDAHALGFRLGIAEPAPPEEELLEKAVALAREADVAVVVVGTTEEVESEGFDRETLVLPGRQDELVRRVAATNPRTVVVVNAGAPVLTPWRDDVPATLLVWFPGQECGNALADVLLGDAEPGGRLPTTWPAGEDDPLPTTRPTGGVLEYAEGLHIGHRAYDRAGVRPAFAFGHGLGYTTWEARALQAPATVTAGEGAVVRVLVRNAGARAGRAVVQVYLSRPDGDVERPARWLAGFAGVEAAAGEEREVEVAIAGRAFAHWDVERGAWAVEPGAFALEAGWSSAEPDLRLRATVEVVSPPRPGEPGTAPSAP